MGRQSKLNRDARGVWRSTINGTRYYFGCDRAKALGEWHRLMAEAGRPVRRDAPLTVAALILKYRLEFPAPDNKYRLADLDRLTGDTPVRDVPSDILAKLERAMRMCKSPLAPKTIIDRVRAAAKCLRWAADNGWTKTEFTMPKMRKPVRRTRDVEPTELAEALAALPKRAGRLCRFIAATGCRPKEARLLRWSEVNVEQGLCVLPEHKTAGQTGTERIIHLTPVALAILDQMPPSQRKGYVFPSREGEPYTAAGLRSILQRRMPGLTPYRLRHTFAQVASEQLSEQDLAKLMGHQDVETTRHYYSVRDARASQLASQLLLPQVASPADSPAP